MSKKKTILIADGLSFSRQVLKLLLRRDYEILEAADGDEALAVLAAKSRQVAAILLDDKLADDSGRDILSYLVHNGLKAKIPVLMLVSSLEPAVQAHAYVLGAVGIIEKPYHQGHILDLLAKHTARYVFPGAEASGESRARRVRSAMSGKAGIKGVVA